MSTHGTNEPVEILLVEDNPGDVRLTEEAFKEARIQNEIHSVRDGEEAMDFLNQRGEYEDAPRPDLMLLDLNLPKMNGEEVLEAVKQYPELKRLPIIALTSSKAEEGIVKAYDLHANAYLTKPGDPDSFIDLVRRLEEFWFSDVTLPPK